MPLFSRYLPSINFAIGTSALSFQMMILYPWHKKLDDDFEELKRDQAVKLQDYHAMKLEYLSTIEQSLADIREWQAARSDQFAKPTGK